MPLYVRFGDESFRDYVELGPHEFYERLPPGSRAADDLAADAGRLPRRLRGARRLRADPLAAPARRSSPGRSRARAAPPRSSAAAACGRSTPGTRLRRARDARARRPAAARARDDRRGARRARRAAPAREPGRSSRSTRSSSSPRAAGSARRRRWPGPLLNIKPILGIEDGEVVPLKRVRGAHKAFLEFAQAFESGSGDGPSLRVGHRARRGARPPRGAARARRTRSARRPRSRSRRCSGRSSARTPGPARSASSGSTTPSRRSRSPLRRCARLLAPTTAGGPPSRAVGLDRESPARRDGTRAQLADRVVPRLGVAEQGEVEQDRRRGGRGDDRRLRRRS